MHTQKNLLAHKIIFSHQSKQKKTMAFPQKVDQLNPNQPFHHLNPNRSMQSPDRFSWIKKNFINDNLKNNIYIHMRYIKIGADEFGKDFHDLFHAKTKLVQNLV
jgi:hypothetical protein